ncbi:ribonuclease HI large subunit [Pseudovirgaria hyperparasitica]|uniref:Ribonuclease n=1 Tax=Pseudovirgaria hyperparasitica TaxID=470096 RepID=A0A6A6VYW3_9PEZI|nr:ribonuclease HI large subunit [Pseudovirgaria hyperparasitica]KAF2755036.1 ribonuclease HI large subunit [Pseudovirgaria hyperparasitica]
MEDIPIETQEIELETPVEDVFMAPSIHRPEILSGASYSHFSPIPKTIEDDMTTECVLGIDEAGRGPVLEGPMVYGLFYLPLSIHRSLLADTHHFDDSKVLTPAVRSSLMEKLCTLDSDLYQSCGWATRVMSARDISSGMMKANGTYNLNAQAMDATIDLIKRTMATGVNIKEIYIDTIGRPEIYQKKLEKIFPTAKITVAKKADSLFPCVSAASVCAKVTRDAALDVCYESYSTTSDGKDKSADGWGSGYPSDARCTTWLKQNMDPVFGWGTECRFSWGTAKDLLEGKGGSAQVDWPADDDDDGMKMTDFFIGSTEKSQEGDEFMNWYGHRVTEKIF